MQYRKMSVIDRHSAAMEHRYLAAVAGARARLQKKIAERDECIIEPIFSNTDLTVLNFPREIVSATDVLSGVFPLTDKCSDIDTSMECLFSNSSLCVFHGNKSTDVLSGVFPLTDMCSDMDPRLSTLFTESSVCSLHIKNSIVSGVFPLTDRIVSSEVDVIFEDIKQPFRVATACDSGYSCVFPLTDWAETPSQFQLFSDKSATQVLSESPSQFRLFSDMSTPSDSSSLSEQYSLTESEIYKWLVDDLCNQMANLDINKPVNSYSSVVSGVFPLTDRLEAESTWDLTGFFDEPARFPSFELSIRDMETDESEHLSGVFPLSAAVSALSIDSDHLSGIFPLSQRVSHSLSEQLSGIFPLTDRITSEDRFHQDLRSTFRRLQNVRERIDLLTKKSSTSVDSGYLADASSSTSSVYTEDSSCSCVSSDEDTGYDTENTLSDVSEIMSQEFKMSGQTLSYIFSALFGDIGKRNEAGADPELFKFNGLFEDDDIFTTGSDSTPAIVDSLDLISPKGFWKRRPTILEVMPRITEVHSSASVPTFKDDETPDEVTRVASLVLTDNWFRHALEQRRASIAESISSLATLSWFDLPDIGFSLPTMPTQTPVDIRHSFSDPNFYYNINVPQNMRIVPQSSMLPETAITVFKGTVIASAEEVDSVKVLVQEERARWMLLALQCWAKIAECDKIMLTLNQNSKC